MGNSRLLVVYDTLYLVRIHLQLWIVQTHLNGINPQYLGKGQLLLQPINHLLLHTKHYPIFLLKWIMGQHPDMYQPKIQHCHRALQLLLLWPQILLVIKILFSCRPLWFSLSGSYSVDPISVTVTIHFVCWLIPSPFSSSFKSNFKKSFTHTNYKFWSYGRTVSS